MNQVLIDMLIRHEGMKLYPYKCPANKLTIGVGRNLEDNGISEDEALYMLGNDLIRCNNELQTFPYYEGLSEARKNALMDMIYNIGLSRFTKFTKMHDAFMAGDYDKASIEMLDSRWAKQVGKRAIELSEIVRTGKID